MDVEGDVDVDRDVVDDGCEEEMSGGTGYCHW